MSITFEPEALVMLLQAEKLRWYQWGLEDGRNKPQKIKVRVEPTHTSSNTKEDK